MKYEAVFGDQSLFFDAHRDCEMVGNGHHKVENGKLMVWNFTEKRWCNSHTNTITISAMRRIIAEPKRWTVEDQKAGRLPDVGSKAVSVLGFCVVDILAVRNGCVVACNSDVMDSRPCVFTIDNFLALYKPIETPEEKAQREEDEFIGNMLAIGVVYMSDYIEGIRAAYRKLKGGE